LKLAVFMIVFVLLFGFGVTADLRAEQNTSPWQELTPAQREEIEQFSAEYKSFLQLAKTELSFVRETISLCRRSGFTELTENSPMKPGARYYDVNRDRSISLIVVGRVPVEEGFHVIGAHIDSPRLELKPRAMYEKEGFVLFQTNFHGGIKTYQWTNIPLALMGRVDKKDGTTVWISIGNNPGEPVFVIPDLAPHVDSQLRSRNYREVIQHEELDPIAGHHIWSKPGRSLYETALQYLTESYGIVEDDFVSAELSLVPALSPRDVGFDRGLMALYGQDDRLSGYAALRAIMELEVPERTAIVYCADNEEVGNVNNTGARSSYLVDLMSRLLYLQNSDAYREIDLRRALKKTRVVSSDVNPGIHPTWPAAFEKLNAPNLGNGVNLKLYGRGFNANSEYIAWMRNLLDKSSIPWQTITYKVGRGGGGTIGGSISDDNMDVIDIGVPVLSIHTPYSVSSKLDVYFLYRAMYEFVAYSRSN